MSLLQEIETHGLADCEFNRIINKLEQAQSLLSDVYHWACENDNQSVERSMSVADSCIIDCFDKLNKRGKSL